MATFSERAIESAVKYYKYLASENKGRIVYNITEIIKGDSGTYFFRLEKTPAVVDTLQLEYKATICHEKTVKFLQFDKKSKLLKLWVNEEFQPILDKAYPEEIAVISDLKFLVQRVENWYRSFGDKIAMPCSVPHVSIFDSKNLLDAPSESQEEAIAGALSTPFSYIWGAPGTGKTKFVLSRCILSYIQEGKKMLVAAPTNNALEQSLRGILSALEEVHISSKKKVLRLGIASAEFASQYPYLCEDSVIAKKLGDIALQKTEHQKRIKSLKETLALLDKYEQHRAELDLFRAEEAHMHECVRAIRTISNEEASVNARISFLEAQIAVEEDNVNSLKALFIAQASTLKTYTSKLDKYKAGWKKKLFSKAYKNALAYLAGATAKAESIRLEKEEAEKKLQDYVTECKKAKEQLHELMLRKKYLFWDFSNTVRNCGKLYGKVAQLGERWNANILEGLILEYEKYLCERETRFTKVHGLNREGIEQEILSEEEALSELEDKKRSVEQSAGNVNMEDCNLIAATIDTCLGRLLPDENHSFDHVFLDEAGYCSLIKAVPLTAFHCPLTFLGDHMQLPPVCEMSDSNFKEEANRPIILWAQSALYVEDVFRGSPYDVEEAYTEHNDPAFDKMEKFDLTQTYRFGEALANVLAEDVYSKEFSGRKDKKTDIFYLDAPSVEGVKETKTRTKLSECVAIRKYVLQHCHENIGIIAPYRNQVDAIKKALKGTGFPKENVMTVHGSQGREWDTVLLSVTDTTTNMFFTNSLLRASNGKRVINTAVSRAKDALVIVCDYNCWSKAKKQLIAKLLAVASPVDKA